MGEETEGGGQVKASGWLFLILSWGLIIALSVFSFYKVLSKKKVD